MRLVYLADCDCRVADMIRELFSDGLGCPRNFHGDKDDEMTVTDDKSWLDTDESPDELLLECQKEYSKFLGEPVSLERAREAAHNLATLIRVLDDIDRPNRQKAQREKNEREGGQESP